jgi:hypothetical protein
LRTLYQGESGGDKGKARKVRPTIPWGRINSFYAAFRSKSAKSMNMKEILVIGRRARSSRRADLGDLLCASFEKSTRQIHGVGGRMAAAFLSGVFPEPAKDEDHAVDRFVGVEDRFGVLGTVDAAELFEGRAGGGAVMGGRDASEDAGAMEEIPHAAALASRNGVHKRQVLLRRLEGVEP